MLNDRIVGRHSPNVVSFLWKNLSPEHRNERLVAIARNSAAYQLLDMITWVVTHAENDNLETIIDVLKTTKGLHPSPANDAKRDDTIKLATLMRTAPREASFPVVATQTFPKLPEEVQQKVASFLYQNGTLPDSHNDTAITLHAFKLQRNDITRRIIEGAPLPTFNNDSERTARLTHFVTEAITSHKREQARRKRAETSATACLPTAAPPPSSGIHGIAADLGRVMMHRARSPLYNSRAPL